MVLFNWSYSATDDNLEQCQAQELELCWWRYDIRVKRQNLRLLTRQSIQFRFPETAGCVLWLSREGSAAKSLLSRVLMTAGLEKTQFMI